MIRIKKDINGKRTMNINIIPKFDFALIFQIIAVLSSWALHESIIRSLLAFIFGFWYLLAWAIFGDSANGDGVRYVIDYWIDIFNK